MIKLVTRPTSNCFPEDLFWLDFYTLDDIEKFESVLSKAQYHCLTDNICWDEPKINVDKASVIVLVSNSGWKVKFPWYYRIFPVYMEIGIDREIRIGNFKQISQSVLYNPPDTDADLEDCFIGDEKSFQSEKDLELWIRKKINPCCNYLREDCVSSTPNEIKISVSDYSTSTNTGFKLF